MRTFWLGLWMSLLVACGTTPAAPIPSDLPANVGVNATLIAADAPMVQVNTPAPDFYWTDHTGVQQQLSALRGQRVIVNFWATWCEPCRSEMPDLDAVNGQDVVVLGVNKGQNVDVIPAFAQELGVTFQLMSDPDGDVSLAYGARNLPTTIFIDRTGQVAAVHLGLLTADALQIQLERIP
jgi:peroxiredoxin